MATSLRTALTAKTILIRPAEGRSPNMKSSWELVHRQFRPFICLLYERLLGRPAVNSELVYWTQLLMFGVTPFRVASEIANSEEGLQYFGNTRL